MKITVAICTWNRSRLLQQTLESLTRLRVPDDLAWDLVIVDNRSQDDTREVIQSFESRLPIRYVFEGNQGHARSRNTAVEQAAGDLIVWTDNDVIVDRNWLAGYAEAALKYPQAAFFGGVIEPVFEAGKPDWLVDTWDKSHPVYAARDLGKTEFQLLENQFPFGANFAIRADVQNEFLYDLRTGRSGVGMVGDDEITVLRRIVAAGHHGVWLPQTKLQHFIPQDRATPKYVGQYFVGQGQANVLKGRPTMGSQLQALGISIHHQVCFQLKRHFSRPDEWVSHLIRSSIAWGEFEQLGRGGAPVSSAPESSDG